MSDGSPYTEHSPGATGGEDPSGYAAICADDVQLRAFIVKHYGAAAFEIDGKVLVENLQRVYDWVRSGKISDLKPRKLKSIAATPVE